jgi:hypothetical protein
MEANEWEYPSVGEQMIRWANEPELYGPHPEDAEDDPNWPMGDLYEGDDYWSLGCSTCSSPTVDGSQCGFPLDRRGSCGVESRHAR